MSHFAVAVDKHWVPCEDGLRHAVFGRATPHTADETIQGMCGTTSTLGNPRYGFQQQHCPDCMTEARRAFWTTVQHHD